MVRPVSYKMERPFENAGTANLSVCDELTEPGIRDLLARTPIRKDRESWR